ncbi:MAG: M23 family metallopeptidase, partial [Lachnospiraceae bacterium]|nr:M23 family metallopeptidase [Lachnospiraceae bacterium]
PDEEAPPEEEPPLEDIQPEETAEEENLPLPPEPVRQKRERRRRKPLFRKFSILVIPENAVNVKSYKISILPLTLCALFLLAVIALAVFSAIYGIRNVRDLRKQVIALNANLINITNANVLLEADKEELENQLREANARLSTTTYLQEQTASAQAMDHIPSGFPLDGQASMPSQYSEEHQYITFPTGMGAKIVATGAGTVVSIIDDNNLGHVLQIDHGNGYISVYYSHSDPLVKEGDSVIRGTTLYIVQGDTETLTYQILYNEKYIDPATIMRIDG